MSASVRPIPEGYHSITPQLTCRNASEAIEFYKKVFGGAWGSNGCLRTPHKVETYFVIIVPESIELDPENVGCGLSCLLDGGSSGDA